MSFQTSLFYNILYLLVFSVGVAKADTPLEVHGGATLASKYLFRGIERYPETVAQPFVTTSWALDQNDLFQGLLWSNIPLEQSTEREELYEIDALVSWDQTVAKRLAISLGHASYTFPSSEKSIEDFHEFFATLLFDVIFSPMLSVSYDYTTEHATYFELGFQHEFSWPPLGEEFSMTPFAYFGWSSSETDNYDSQGLVHVTYGISTDIAAGRLILSPSLSLSESHDDANKSEVWLSLTVRYE